MGFLKDSSNNQSFYLEVKQEPTLVRPLASRPQSVWVHKIQEVKTTIGGQPQVLRKFAYETCTANNRSGSGCTLCSTPDPLWHMLPADEQTNRQGKRVDFPKTPIHFLPVFNHSTQQTEAMKGGNQIFGEMDKWYDAQPDSQKDLRRCDWRVWKTGERKTTKYQSIRLDASAFEISADLETQAKSVLMRAIQDRAASEPAKLLALIKGENAPALPEGAPVTAAFLAPLPPAPALPPGNFAVTTAFPSTAPANLPTVAAPKTVVQEIKAVPGNVAPKGALDAFTAWIGSQPEFQGMGMIQALLPMLKTEIGHAEYTKLSADQLVNLQKGLDAKLAEKRSGK